MPGAILHQNATVVCMHGGIATPVAVDPRVSVSGQNVVTQVDQDVVAGCPLPPPPFGPGPCVVATWMTAATRVRASGQPLLLEDSQAICVPTGTGLQVVAVQQRVMAQ
jgi:hypothetical protein